MRWSGAMLLAFVLAGCVSGPRHLVRPAPESLPPASPLRSRSLPESDAWLRHHLMFAEHDRALKVLHDSPVAPGDPLVRALQEALVLRQAGDFQRSNAVLEWAEVEADRRFTRSLSRAAGALLVNDRVMAYTPTAAELGMIPYYRMLNYLALGQMEGALVEARKANALLARLDRDAVQRCGEDALLQYLAGLVQRAGGEANDALVSLRQAEQSFAACGPAAGSSPAAVAGADLARAARALGLDEAADSAVLRHSLPEPSGAADAGDLVVLVEHGYVVHRAERALHVPIFPEDIEGLEGRDEDGVGAAAARISERLLGNLVEQAAWGSSWDDSPAVQLASAMEGAYVMRLAWPALRREPVAPAAVRVWVGDSPSTVIPVGNVSAVVEQELEAQRVRMLGRLVARGLAKYLVTREAEKKMEEKNGELAGFLVGRLANLAANELERADTRSWSLLPDRISLVRLRLPAGEHRVRVEALDSRGAVLTARDLGPVSVRAGELEVLNERVWGAELDERLDEKRDEGREERRVKSGEPHASAAGE